MLKGGNMENRLNKMRLENPGLDKKIVDTFARRMPKLLNVILDGEEYDNHIGSKDVAMLAKDYITDKDGAKIGFHWSYDDVVNTVKGYVDFDKVDFYPCDLFVWANVKYGDMGHITSDSALIIKYAISELTDSDFPFYPADQRAYCWLKKHVEEEEKN